MNFFVVLREAESEATFIIRESSWGSRWIQRSHLSRAKTDPCSNLCFMIDKILQSNSLSPTLAASVLGKFGFLCSTWFGKVGRCRMGALRARQDGCSDDYHLTPDIITCLRLMKLFAQHAPRRELDRKVVGYWELSSLTHSQPRRSHILLGWFQRRL